MQTTVNDGKESFDVVQCGEKEIYNVRNNNKGTIYSVYVNNGIPNKCTCPHHHYRGAFCKHMSAVECRFSDPTPTLHGVEMAVADGGQLVDEKTSPAGHEDTRKECRAACDCDSLGGFPCWNCVRAGKKEIPQ